MFESIRVFVEGVEPIWQWLAVIVAGAIPFIESYFASVLGILVGVPWPVAIIAGIIGNWMSMFLVVTLGHKIRESRKDKTPKEESSRMRKFRNAFNKYGVIGVSLIGQTILPSQLTSFAMVTLGAPKAKVIFWQTISIILWGVAFGLLALLGVDLVTNRI